MGALIPLGEHHVIRDDERGRAGEVVDERRMDEARPGPVTDELRHTPDAVFVDRHDDEVAAGEIGTDGRATRMS
jgi:hypothetical protein